MKRRFVPEMGLVLAVALAVLAALPFLIRPGLPRDTDAELHVFRAAEVSACWQAGVLYPRWAPDFYYGYGYPIFNYYAPLTYILSSVVAILPGVTIVTGVKSVFVSAFLLGGVGTYLLTRDLLGPGAGVAGAAAFLFAPYVLFIDPHARGDLAEHLAVGLLPLAMFFLFRLVKWGGRVPLLGTAILIAALVTSHNLIGAIGVLGLLAAFIWLVLVEGYWSGARRGLLGLALAAALSCFFWLPMVVELDLVHLSVVGGGHFDFRNHFVSLGELLAPSRLIDLGASAPRYRLNLGFPQWLLAVLGAGAMFRLDSGRRRSVQFFLILAALLVFLMVSPSLLLWEAVPVLAYLQFPWRLLGPAALALAVLVGAVVAELPEMRPRLVGLATMVGLLLVFALPTMFPHPWPAEFGDTSPEGIIRFELEGSAVGTTSTGDFLPRPVRVLLQPETQLVQSYAGPGPIDKVNRATLSEDTTVEVVEHGPTHDLFHVSSTHDFVLRLYTLVFPGWRAYVGDQEVPIEPGRPEGFVTLRVPEGEHEVLVRFGDTPVRTASWWIAAGGVLGLVVSLARLGGSPTADRQVAPLDGAKTVWVVGVLAAFVLVKVAVVDPNEGWFRLSSAPGEALEAPFQQRAVLGGQIEFLGFDLPRQQVRSGKELVVVLYWRALEPLEANYQSFVHLTYPSAISWGQSDTLNPGGLPTSRWSQDSYVWDVHRVQTRTATPPGEYALEAGLYTREDGRRLPVVDGDGNVTGETVVLDVPVEVLPAVRQPQTEELGMSEELGVTYTGQVTLLGYAAPSVVVETPGFLHLTLFWRAEREQPDELAVTVAVVDEEGEPVAMASGAPAVGRYPTSSWSRGEIVRDAYAFWLGEEFSLGEYRVWVVVHHWGQPITADGLDDPHLELFVVEVQRWEE